MSWLNRIWTQLDYWWTARRVKKIANKLDSPIFLDLRSLPEAPIDPFLADGDETEAFEKGFDR